MKLTFTQIFRFITASLLFVASFSTSVFSQVAATYGFTQSAGTFTPITGGTVLGIPTNDDTSFPSFSSTGYPIGFPFTYNGEVYTSFGVNSNGWIRLDSGTFAMDNSYSPLNGFGSNFRQIVTALSSDLQGKAGIGELSYIVEGSSPNQTLVVQWLNYAKYQSINNLNDTLNFQIRLNETSNTIDIVYGNFIFAGLGRAVQVGINGNNLTDFVARETATDWTSTVPAIVNTATCSLTTTIFPSSGLTFTFGILSGDIDAPVIANDTISPLSSCNSVSHTVSADITDASGVASAEILWTLNGVQQAPIIMTNVGTLYSGVIPASGSGNINFSIRATDLGPNNIIGIEPGLSYQDDYLSLSAGQDKLINAGDSVTLKASSPFLSALKITEVTLFSGGTGTQPTYPPYITATDDNIEITNLSSLPIDISGYTLGYIFGTAPVADTLVFPAGTIIPSDSLAIVHIGSVANDSLNRYFSLPSFNGPTSGTGFGMYLKDQTGNVLDAVAINSFAFPSYSGVSTSDFNGVGVISPGGFAGPSLTGTDLNDNTNWIQSSASDPTSMGFKNVGLPLLTVPTVTWSGGLFSSSVTGAVVSTPIHPTPGVFTYVASISDGICTSTDTVVVNVIAPTSPDAEFSVNATSGTTGGVNTIFTFTDLSTNLPSSWLWSFTPNTVTFINGTSASSQNPVVIFDSAAVYSVTLTASNTAGSNSEVKPNLITITIAFCVSSATSTVDDDIGNVTFGTLSNGIDTIPALNNPTSINTYSDFSALPPENFAAGSNQRFSLTQINSGTFYACSVGVYIDYNQDGAFDVTTETAFTGNTSAANRVSSGIISIPSTALVGNTKMRVVLEESGLTDPCGTYTWGETEDYTINITPPPANDASVFAIDTPNSGCVLSAAEVVRVRVSNGGTNILSNLPVSYSINGGTPITEFIAGPIPALTIITYDFITTANLSAIGSYAIEAFTSLFGDATPSNDTSGKTIFNNPLVNTFPYIQDFSTANSWVSTPLTGTENWTIQTSVPIFPPLLPVFGTGVAVLSDNSSSAPIARYAYTCGFDFTNLSFPRAELYVLQDNASQINNDSIAVDVSTDNGITYTTVGSIARYNAAFTSSGWGKFEVSLGAYGGQSNVLVAIRGVVDFFSDVAVDQFRIYQPAPIDAGVVSVDSLIDGCGLSSTSPVFVSVKNFGSTSVTSTQISFQVDGGAIITETANITIDPDSTVSYLFTGTANLSAPGIHVVKAFTTLTGDSDATNDTASATSEAFPTSLIPTVNNAAICSGAPAVLTASGTAISFNWYDALTGGNLLFTGTSYSVSPTIPTNYYVEGTDVVSSSVGPLDTTIGNFSLQNPTSAGLFFDVLTNSILDSVAVFPGFSGIVSIELVDALGSVLDTFSYPVIGGAGKQWIPVNFTLAPGLDYLLKGAFGSTATVQRNSDGTAFPYNSTSVVITDGTVSGFYYYFYDWQLTSIGCPSPRATAQVSINTAPVVNLGANQSICAGSPLVLDAGNVGSSYLWSTGALTQTITINVGGTYSVTVTGANGCTASDAITITAGSLPIVSLGADAGLCPGAVLILDAGNAGSSYVWSTGATSKTIVISAAGSYSVTVTNAGGCVASDAITISASPAAVSTFTNIQANISQEVTFTPTNPLGTHLWTFGTGGPTSTLASPTFTFSPYGVYQVTHTFTTPDGCSSTTVQLVTVLNVGFNNKFESSFSYTIYPNPIQTETTISYELKDRSQIQVNVYDVLGRKVAELVNATQTSGKHEMRLSSDKFTSGAGVYEIQLMVNGTSETLRVIKAE